MKRLAIATAFLFAAGAAQATTLLCKVEQKASQLGWIPEEILLDYDLNAGTGFAHDGITEYYEGGKVAAKVTGSEDKKVALSWTVMAKDSKGQQTRFQYRASWFPGKNQVIVRTVPGAGFRGNFEGRGTCSIK